VITGLELEVELRCTAGVSIQAMIQGDILSHNGLSWLDLAGHVYFKIMLALLCISTRVLSAESLRLQKLIMVFLPHRKGANK
jgi:hypothetical protein